MIIIINAVVFILSLGYYIYASIGSPGNAYNGLVFYPMILVAIFSLVAIMAMTFVMAVAGSVRTAPGVGSAWSRYYGVAMAVLAILLTLALLHFAYIADDRQILRTIGWTSLSIAGAGLLVSLVKLIKYK